MVSIIFSAIFVKMIFPKENTDTTAPPPINRAMCGGVSVFSLFFCLDLPYRQRLTIVSQ